MLGAGLSAVSHPRTTSRWSVRLHQGPPGTTSSLFVCCSGLQRGRNSVHLQGVSRLPFHRSEFPEVFQCIVAKSLLLPTSHRPEQYPTGYSLHDLPCHGPRWKKPPFNDGLFYALATRRHEGVRVGEGGA